MENSRYKAFVTSVDAGSFTKAAEELNYTPSGIYQLVNALEKELGFDILIRDKKGVFPTDNGNKILPDVRELLRQEEKLNQLAAEINCLAMGNINIGAYSSIATHWLPGVIKSFQEKYPKIKIHLMEGIRQEIISWLDDKKIDMAFISYEDPMKYDWIPLDYDPMIAVLPRNHPFAKKKKYPLINCQKEDFIMPALGRDDDVLALFKKNHLTPQIAFSTLENFATIGMIEQGLGMSIMNELITKRWDFDVKKLPLDPPQFITLGIALGSVQNVAPAAKQFIAYAVKRLKKIKD